MAGLIAKEHLEVMSTVGATYKVDGVKPALSGDTGFSAVHHQLLINDCSNGIVIQFRVMFRVACLDCPAHATQPCFHRLHRRALSVGLQEENNLFSNVRLILWDVRSKVPVYPLPNTVVSPREESPLWYSVMEPLERGWRAREMTVPVATSNENLVYDADGSLSVSITVKMTKRSDPFLSRMEAINVQNTLAMTDTTAKRFIDHLLSTVKDLTFVTSSGEEIETYANMFICHTNFFRFALDAPFVDMMNSRIIVNMSSATLRFFMDWMAYGIVGPLNYFENAGDVFDESRANVFDVVSFAHMWEIPRLLNTVDSLMVMHVSEFNGWSFRGWAQIYNLERTLLYAETLIESQQHLMAAAAADDKLFQNEYDF